MSNQVVLGRNSDYAAGTLVSSSKRGLEANTDGIEARYRQRTRNGLRAGAGLKQQPFPPIQDGGVGPIVADLLSNGLSPLFASLFGTAAVTTPGGATLARAHTFTSIQTSAAEWLYLQKVVETEDGTDGGIFTLKGGSVQSLGIAQAVGDGEQVAAKVTANTDFKTLVTNASKDTATYRTVGDQFGYANCTVTLGGVVPCANNFNLNIDKSLDISKRCLDAADGRHAPKRNGFPAITGDFEVVHQDNDLFDLWASGDDVELVIAWESAVEIESGTPYSCTIRIPSVVVMGDTPQWQVGSAGTQSVKLEAVDNNTDEPITVEFITSDTSL